MSTLLVLLAIFIISISSLWLLKRRLDFLNSGRIALSAMLLFAATGHFIFTEGMAMMLPMFVPLKMEIVFFTGILEIVFAFGILSPRYRIVTGWVLIVFLALALPANIYAAINHVNYQQATYGGPGPVYLWFRIPLQIFFIGWTYVTCIYLITMRNKIHIFG